MLQQMLCVCVMVVAEIGMVNFFFHFQNLHETEQIVCRFGIPMSIFDSSSLKACICVRM